MNRDKLYADLVRDEGKKLRAYQDSKGLWTIGIGHLIDDHGQPPRMTRITEDECRALFDFDTQWAIDAVVRMWPKVLTWPYQKEPATDVRMRALVNMAFNRGERNMRGSTTISPAITAAIDGSGDWAAVSKAILASPWAAQIGKRADRLAHMLETGTDPV